MKYVIGLRCKECGADYPTAPQHVCETCFGPLEVVYDYEAVGADISRRDIESGPQTLWRYGALLPMPSEGVIDIGAGWSRFRAAPRLAAELGLKKLWLKIEAGNPTHSFKDRVVTVALSVARSFGYRVAACASTGNLANAVAAHAAASGMESVVFIPHDLESGKVAGTVVYGGQVLAVRGSYDDVNRLCAELVGETDDWAFVNVNFRPFYSEGSKSLGFEVAEQLGWRAPDAIVAPVASGSLVTKVAKAFRELTATGLIEGSDVTIHGAQAEGCSPVAQAFAAGADEVRPVKPATVAKSLGIGNPADGYYVLKEVRACGGQVVSVREDDVATGMKLLARTEGLFTETAGGVTISALESLVRQGHIAPDDETVALITGIGLKTLEALDPLEPTALIDADVEEVQAIITRR